MINFLKRQTEHFYPGYFAMVMATGALSLSAWYLGYHLFAEILLYLNIVVYFVLIVLNIIRLSVNTKAVWSDFTNEIKGPGFFTFIAASSVIGSQLSIISNMPILGFYIWVLILFLWIVLIYSFFTILIIKKSKPLINESINGGWLLLIVSTQSLAILGVLMQGPSNYEDIIMFISLCLFFLACMLYLAIIVLIFYRLMFFEMEAMSLTPPYWISMGALAITTLAGAIFILNGSGIILEFETFIKATTLFFWAFGTWWIPLLVVLGIWRHVIKKVPLNYNPELWGMAFPLAMYTVGTINLSQALELSFLMIIPDITYMIALMAWGLIFIGMVVHHGKRLRRY
ncbi:tellurite resistance/C4-dicarboxylate transporter family protein [Jeotgalicoccus marinus]|uniref:tellurite resistance/C4-dicarboxylate transporter family protein n=1 Tax=Jeotgalicoccus marinus TaxID=516700 RepID=UPI0004075CC6|nr:tellurite resistance/C4-dicarboxylate transporter family protein [Jeotgalicoccus marinus]